MSGETDLAALLRGLSPVLDPIDYLYLSLSREQAARYQDQAWMWCEEAEGTTVILPVTDDLPESLSGRDSFSRITLKVHSSLHAVGLTAAVSRVLGDENIPANMVAGFYHDHVFVPSPLAMRAMDALQGLARSA
ncbi:MAG: ACT domain-containing protein [Pseudomonadota bacterium]